MMAEFLELARVIIEKRESAKSATFRLNEHQCNRLWRNLRSHYDYYFGTLLCLQPTLLRSIFREFYLIVTRADAIQQHFSSACSWLQAAVLQGDHRQAFEELNENLQDCARSFRETTKSMCSVLITDSDALSWRYEDTERDSEMDLLNLRIELLQFKPADEGEKLLAEYIIEREKSRSSTDNDQDASLPKFYTLTCGYPTPILELIGCGSFGSVCKVNWLGMICAKKHLRASVDEDFMKEVKTLKLLNHPNIVKLLSVGAVTSEASFLMEYMPMSLFDYYTQRQKNSEPISILAAIDIMKQFARGMEYLHEHRTVHRDLKSTNVLVAPSADEMLRKEGYCDLKVADLGSAKMQVCDLTWPTRDRIGTTKWRAPEVFWKKAGRSDWRKADIYSFAMTCSEVLTGEQPFMYGELNKLFHRIQNGERPELPSTCPQELKTLLEDCWHSKPRKRPTFADIGRRLASIRASLLKGLVTETTISKNAVTGTTISKNAVTEIKNRRRIRRSRLQDPAAITNNVLTPIELKLVEVESRFKANESPTTTPVAVSNKCLEMPVSTHVTQAAHGRNIFLSLTPPLILIIVSFFTSKYQK